LTRHVEELQSMDKSGKGETPSVIRDLLDSKIPDEEKTTARLTMEGRALLAGGTDTTSHTLTTITYHLLANPDKLVKLKKELETVMPDGNVMPECMAVETLPYLNAVIREGLRINTPVGFTMERIATEEDLEYKSPKDGKTYVIPRGVIVGITPILLGKIESLYPEPDVFRPERFLDNPELEKFQLPFGRGTRRCLGENLAMAELRVLLAAIFRKFEVWDGTDMQSGQTMELYETGREDVDMASTYILPFIKEGRKGVRVVVRNGSI
jgi:cytochrome P450